jgi:hypothetical protein|tara:strand:+ start:364 stop:564 length:201 start_codon:yes stop_codon:yes gene_type:complete
MVHSTDIKRLRQEYRDTKNKSEMYERNKAKIKAHDYTSQELEMKHKNWLLDQKYMKAFKMVFGELK